MKRRLNSSVLFLLGAVLLATTGSIRSHAACEPTMVFTGRSDWDEGFGWSVAAVGDIDGDGYADVVVGEYSNDADGIDVGRAYVYSGLSGAVLWSVAGEDTSEYFGFSVSGAGDVNSDGTPDVIIGAHRHDAAGINSGRAYVYSGVDGSVVWTFTGEAAVDNFGYSVSGAGDVDNDGFDDLIIGARNNDAGGADAGRAYVYSGQLGSLLWTFTGEAAGDLFGFSVSGAGDVDNDGFDDLIVGARLNDAGGVDAGRAYVYSGLTGSLIWTYTGVAAGDRFGWCVSGAGDVNNDGYADVIIAATRHDAGGVDAGRAYVYSGQTGALLWAFDGEVADDRFGVSVSGAGDVDNDGFADLIVGAFFNDAGGADAGRAYVYAGRTGALLYTFTGEASLDWFGRCVAGVGDVDNDGIDDVIVGAPIDPSAPVNDGGHAYIYSGQSGGLIRRLASEVGHDWALGSRVSGAGDVNGDGYPDVILGVSSNSANGYRSGRAYVFSGLDATRLYTFTGEAPEDLLSVSAGAGDVDNDGFDDVIIGAPWHDAGGTDAGRAYVFSGRTGDTLWIFDGEQGGDHLSTCSGAGDVNNDGHDDLIVGAPSKHAGAAYAGRAYIFSGLDGSVIYTFDGHAAEEHFGTSVAGAGDVNADGYPDVIIGAYAWDRTFSKTGWAYVYSGLDGTLIHTLVGEAAGDQFGLSVSGAGDVDGDGHDDLIVGAPYNDAGGDRAGRAYVFSGLSGGILHVFTGSDAEDFFGRSVSSAGDVDADGYPDVLVGASGNDDGGIGSGRAYIFSGHTGALLYVLTGESDSGFGYSVASIGDLNSDGRGDVLIGALGYQDTANAAGRAYIYVLGDVDEYSACRCQCHVDPVCDGVTDVLDVVSAIAVALRGTEPSVDPVCSLIPTDTDCNGVTDVLDVVHFVNVAFRGNDPVTEFEYGCNP